MPNKWMTYLYNVVTLWNTLSTKLDADAVISGERWREHDAECSVNILHDINVNLGTLWAADATCDLTSSGLRGVDCDDGFLFNRDGRLKSI